MTAPYGPLKVGRVTLTGPWEIPSKSGDARTLTLAGQEAVSTFSAPTQAQLRAKAEGLLAQAGRVVPVVFTGFGNLDGWYRVGSPSAEESTWYDITIIEWSLDLTLVGRDGDVEVESRLVGGNRIHATGAAAELWHAPPVGADSYLAGSGSPGYVDRTSADGTVRVFRAIPASTNPRWGVAGSGYLAGAAQVTVNGDLMTGLSTVDTPTSWQASNGLIRVEPRTSAGTLRVTSYLTSGWGTPKVFDVKRNGVSLGAAKHVTVIRNDPAEVVLRLTWDHAPARSTLDVAVKRGARHASLAAQQSNVAGAWRIDDNAGGGTVTDQLSAAGYIASTSDDADGNRWLLGTVVAATAAGTFGFVASAAAAALAGFVGVVRSGASAVAGDTAAQVNAQFLGTPSETERVIAR